MHKLISIDRNAQVVTTFSSEKSYMADIMAIQADQARRQSCESIIPEDFNCPGTCEVMQNPVVHKECGNSFEMEFVQKWLEKSQTCMVCRAHATMDDFVVNRNLSAGIQSVTKILNTLDTAEKKEINSKDQKDPELQENVGHISIQEQAPPKNTTSTYSTPVTARQLCIELDVVAFKAPAGNASAENKRTAAKTAYEKIRAKMRKENAIKPFTQDEQRVIREAFVRNRSFMQGKSHNSNLTTILGGLKTIQSGH